MTLPVPERIAVEIVERLERITTTNSYSFDVGTVWRPSQKAEEATFGHQDIVLRQVSQIPNELQARPGNPPAIAYDLTFAIECVVAQDRTETGSREALENEMAAAVIRAITNPEADPSYWHTMDGNAIYSNFGIIQPFFSQAGDHAGCSVSLIVTYRVSENNPFEVRA